MKYLLDVSTLIALINENHVYHSLADQWSRDKELVLCPITELGFIRVYTGAFKATMPEARQALRDFISYNSPGFVPCSTRVLYGPAAPNSAKTTDWYLANLAQKRGMKWATLDQGANHPAAELIK